MGRLYLVILSVIAEDAAPDFLLDAKASSDRHHGYSDVELLDHAHPHVLWALMGEGICRYSLQVLTRDANVKEHILVQLPLSLREQQHVKPAHHPESAQREIQHRTLL